MSVRDLRVMHVALPYRICRQVPVHILTVALAGNEFRRRRTEIFPAAGPASLSGNVLTQSRRASMGLFTESVSRRPRSHGANRAIPFVPHKFPRVLFGGASDG